MARKKPREVKQWDIPCRVECHSIVTVEAYDEADAMKQFERLQWIHEQHQEIVNFEATGEPEDAS